MIRTLVVDDEEPARERMRQLLAGVPGVDVVGEAGSGEEAIERITALKPDLILLDIQMPGASGLEVTASLPRPRPMIIFCTAFDQYAVDAFELHAVDYLLKPVNRARLAQAIDRVKAKPEREAEIDMDRVADAVHGKCGRLLARSGEAYRVISQREVVYLSSEGGLTRLNMRDKQYVLDPTLNELEDRLDPRAFFRISRAAIVNLDFVAEVRPLIGGFGEALMKTGAVLEVSRRRLKELLEKLEGGGLSAG